MWPSEYFDQASFKITIETSPLHQKAKQIAKGLLGDDMEFDFDMLISKVNFKLFLKNINTILLLIIGSKL